MPLPYYNFIDGSREPNITISQINQKGDLQGGLWYNIRNGLVKLAKSKEVQIPPTHTVYELKFSKSHTVNMTDPHTDKILAIRNEKKMKEFLKKFSLTRKEGNERITIIDWPLIKKLYGGIEISYTKADLSGFANNFSVMLLRGNVWNPNLQPKIFKVGKYSDFCSK